MQVIAEIAPLREQILQWRRERLRIAFIPTKGNIHDGHLSLVRKARENADIVVVSIFVNPSLHDKKEELPLTTSLDKDLSSLNSEGVELVFAPSIETLYPNGIEHHTVIEIPNLSTLLNASSHPNSFHAITTLHNKLFNLVQPDLAYFGEKNFLQLTIINKMVEDLCLPIAIMPQPAIREMDGLVKSGVNKHLTVDERQRAPVLCKTLRWISNQIRAGRNDYNELILDGKDQLRAAGLEPDDIFIRDAQTLLPITEQTSKAVIHAASFLGIVRLIDNLTVDLAPPISDEEE